jgi:hypothetical protein
MRLLAALVLPLFALPCIAQQAAMPPDYRGLQTYIPGIYVTPVPNAPFTATVTMVSQQKLPDGTTNTRTGLAHIARNGAGVIYNERRVNTVPGFKTDPALLSTHIYDPATRLSTFINPTTHLAHQMVLSRPPAAPAHSVPEPTPAANPLLKEEQLGTQYVGAIELHGTRKSRTVPAAMSGTGQPVIITDDYWYSPDLSIYLILKHNDPRTGEQIVGVTEVERGEPPTSLFAVPSGYKVVDETPVPPTPTHP